MGISLKSNYVLFFVSCFDIGKFLKALEVKSELPLFLFQTINVNKMVSELNYLPFFSIAKPNNCTILRADSLNINDSSRLKFIDGLKFILCIQNKVYFGSRITMAKTEIIYPKNVGA